MALSCVADELPDPWSDPAFWDVVCPGGAATSAEVRLGADCLQIGIGPRNAEYAKTYTFDPATHELRSVLFSWEHTWCEYALYQPCVSQRCVALCGPVIDSTCTDGTLVADLGFVVP